MTTAVLRFRFASPVLPVEFLRGVGALRAGGFSLVEYTAIAGEEPLSEVALLRDPDDPWSPEDAASACERSFGVEVTAGPVTYVSRGTDEDAESVLRRFELDGRVRRVTGAEGEIVFVTVSAGDMRRVPESRLHTALEAALNTEVRIELVETLSAG